MALKTTARILVRKFGSKSLHLASNYYGDSMGGGLGDSSYCMSGSVGDSSD